MKFYAHESCGWCIPCREGTTWLRKVLVRIHDGAGQPERHRPDRRAGEEHAGPTFCPLGDAAAMPTIAFVEKFREEFEAHLHGVGQALGLRRAPSPPAPGGLRGRRRPRACPTWARHKVVGCMADLVNLTIDGKPVQAAPGTLVIDAARSAGIEIPTFCYYEGLSLQAACRMCLVEVEKMPKLMASCTLPVAEGMVVRTETPQVVAARKSMLEFLLTNHPLDCPVCDKGGECELQDMVFRYGAGESRFTENKVHTPEKQWSPVVFYDAPRCILCFRCVRVCNEGMGVGALSIVNRGVVSEIAPNKGDHLECDECGAVHRYLPGGRADERHVPL